MNDLIIIGAGPVGIYAGFQSGLRNVRACIVDASPLPGGQLTSYYPEKPIYDIPGIPSIKASEFITSLMTQFHPFSEKIPLHLSSKIQSLDFKDGQYQVITEKGETFSSSYIMIATGAGMVLPKPLDVDHESVKGHVHYSIQDLSVFQNKDVAVLGGGDSALDWANVLLTVARSVTLIHRRTTFRAMEHSLTAFQEKGTLFAGYELKSIHQVNEGIQLELLSQEASSNQTIHVDEIVVCYGFLTTKGIYESWGLKTQSDGIQVNTYLETNRNNIFAVGNVAHYEGKSHTIASGFGEVTQVMETIQHRLFPGKKIIYSSFLKRP